MRDSSGLVPLRLSAQEVVSGRTGYLLECGAGELLDSGGEGHVAGGGDVGLSVVGEPVQQADQRVPGGLVWLAGVEECPAVSADGVAAGAGLVDDGEVGRGDVGFLGGGGGDGLGGRDDVMAGLVADFGERQQQALRICLLDLCRRRAVRQRWSLAGDGWT